MAVTDPVGDFLTRIRNALMARHAYVEVPASKLLKAICDVLLDQGYIRGYRWVETPNNQGKLVIALKYDPRTGEPAIRELKRVSKPSRRVYAPARRLPRVYDGLGIAIISTSQGVMTDKEARRRNIGGEVLCYIF